MPNRFKLRLGKIAHALVDNRFTHALDAVPFTPQGRRCRMEAFKSGDSAAFEKIYQRYQKPIAQYVAGRIRDAELAEETVQEIFIKVYRFRDSYDEKHAFSTWLWTIARNTAFDALRKSRSSIEGQATSQTGPGEDQDPLSPEDLPSELHDAETLLVKRDLRKWVFKLTKPLTTLQKRVLWMRVVQQRSYAEIAKHLNLSLSAVKNLAYRAKITLSENIERMPVYS